MTRRHLALCAALLALAWAVPAAGQMPPTTNTTTTTPRPRRRS